MSARAFVDTNVLLRALIPTLPLHKETDALVKEIRYQGYELWISRQVIREYLVQITRPQVFMQPLTIAQVEYHISMLEKLFSVADETAQVTAELLKLIKEISTGGKQIHDANIIATMLTYKIEMLLTTNIEDMKRFETKVKIMALIHSS